jgi:type 1 glutamine amidotransferase
MVPHHGKLERPPFDPNLSLRATMTRPTIRDAMYGRTVPTMRTGGLRSRLCRALASLLVVCVGASLRAEDLWLDFPGGAGVGHGKHVVLVSGDEEYRSEEALPQLAKILSQHHGFHCTVLFAIDPESGEIDPNRSDNIPGLEQLRSADLLILFTRFRNLPDPQMQLLVDYIEAGKPILGMRTATHAFQIPADRQFTKYANDYAGADFPGGFGQQVLGEKWVAHHGEHGVQSTRGVIAPGAADHPICRGLERSTIWGPSDVYRVNLPLSGDGRALVLGEVLTGMQPDDPAVDGPVNDPKMPIAWVRTYRGGRVFATTMGAATDLVADGTRRMLVNATLWCLGMDDQIRDDLTVDLIGDYQPTPFRFDGFIRHRHPADLR